MTKKYIILTDSDGNHFLKGWMTFDIFLSAVASINGDNSWLDYLTEIFYEDKSHSVADWVGDAKIEIRHHLSLGN